MRTPELTIGIPTYNSGKFIVECIQSVLNQDYSNYEILVVDNDSADNTLELVRSFKDERIRILKNEQNQGPHFSINRIHQEALGSFVRCLCSDDVLIPGVLAQQIELFHRLPGLGLASCDYLLTNENLGVKEIVRTLQGVRTGEEVKNICFANLTNKIGGPSNFMYPRASARGITVRTDIKYLGDLEYALQLLAFGYYASTSTPGVLYRRHTATDTSRIWSEERETADWMQVVALHGTMTHHIALRMLCRKKSAKEKAVLRQWWCQNILNISSFAKGIVSVVALSMGRRVNHHLTLF